MKKSFDFLRKHQTLIGFVLIFSAAFFFRNYIAQRDLDKMERVSGCRFAPFMAESAVMYSYINSCADGKDISEPDPALSQVNRPVAEQMTLSLEYAGGWLLKLRRAICGVPPEGEYERAYSESRFIRYCFTAFIALAPAMIFLALRMLKIPWLLAVSGALINVFSPAALGRYTGQDLIKGAAAWPFLCAFLACYAAVPGNRHTVFRRMVYLLGAALSAALAVITWDAGQLVIGMLAASSSVLTLLRGKPSAAERDFWLITFVAMSLTMLLNPYCQAHGTLFSPVMIFLLPTAILLNVPVFSARKHQWIVLAAVLLTTFIISSIAPFRNTYGHFAELLAAKLKFFNSLPDDPELLTFDQRYLWTPELHSATWQITRHIYPAALRLLAAASLLITLNWIFKKYCRKQKLSQREKARLLQGSVYAVLTLCAFVLYIYFMRFRDMTMLFAAVALPVNIYILQKCVRKRMWRWSLTLLLLLAVAAECRSACRTMRGYPQTLPATANLIKALRHYDFEGKTILCDMQTSAYLKGYTNASILIQPKYELPEVRKLTQDFVNKYFHAPLDEFSIFCSDNQVRFVLVHLPVTLTPPTVKYSYTYIAGVKQLKADSAAVRLALKANPGENFYEITLPEAASGQAGYRLYYFIEPSQRAEAQRLCEQARLLHYAGQTKQARKLIAQAYRKAPGPGEIYNEYAKICRKVPPELKLKKRELKK